MLSLNYHFDKNIDNRSAHKFKQDEKKSFLLSNFSSESLSYPSNPTISMSTLREDHPQKIPFFSLSS